MKYKEWAKAAAVRAIKTLCQTAIATIGVAATMSAVNWVVVLDTSLLAAILSIFTSVITGLPEVDIKNGGDKNE